MYPSLHFVAPFLLLTLVSGSPLLTSPYKIPYPSNTPNSAVSLPKTIASLSIETCYILDYLGDVNKANTLSHRLLQNIQDLSGQPPIIRIGGHTQDVAQYCASCTTTLQNVFQPGNAEAISVTFNKDLFTVLNSNVPSHQEFIFGLNLGQNDVSHPLAEVAAAEKYLHKSRLVSYELGNEPDFYGSSQRPRPWNVQTYTDQIVQWINEIVSTTKTSAGWQIGALAQLPEWQGNFSLPEFNVLGVPSKIKNVKSYSDHTYPYSICDATRASQVSLPGLMNHSSTVSYFQDWIPSIKATHASGLAFTMGETGSVSCHGKDGVSNTVGAALWELDYVLNGATLGMQGVYFHMGTPFFYSMWQPVASAGVPARVYPTYYTLLILASALSRLADPYVVSLPSPPNAPNLALYAIYSSKPSSSSRPSSLIVLNMNYHASNSNSPRAVQSLNTGDVFGNAKLQVSRFTSQGADAITGATFRGQDWTTSASPGVAVGKTVWESVSGGIVTVGDSEGILVEVV